MIAALYVETGGGYFGLPHVDPWDQARDARTYSGPHRIIAHPPCQRWGRFWHGSTRKPHQYQLGADDGCFAAALAAVRRFGGVIEHPADSHAWAHFNLNTPPREGGWVPADFEGGSTCYVEQGFYGHASRKPTWLYAHGVELPELRWGRGEQRIPQWMLDRYGYEKARRIGVVRDDRRKGQDEDQERDASGVSRPADFNRIWPVIPNQGNLKWQSSERGLCAARTETPYAMRTETHRNSPQKRRRSSGLQRGLMNAIAMTRRGSIPSRMSSAARA